MQGLCSVGHSYLTAWISQHVVADFRIHLFSHLHTLSISFFTKRRTGELMSRLMNDVTVIQHVVTETPVDSAKQLVTFIGGVAFLFVMNWRLCLLLILLLLPLLVLVAKLFGRRLKALSTSIQDRTASISTLVEEVIAGIRVVKSFVQAQREERRFKAHVQAAMDLALRRAAVLAVFIPVITFFTFAAAAAVLWYGGRQVIEGTVTPGDLFAFVLFAGILIGPSARRRASSHRSKKRRVPCSGYSRFWTPGSRSQMLRWRRISRRSKDGSKRTASASPTMCGIPSSLIFRLTQRREK